MSARPLPQPTDVTKPYWEAAKEGKLVIQKCTDCGEHQFYPRPYCMSCGSQQIEWVAASGKGTIYTFTINHRPANEYMKDKTPYVVAAIDLDEGVRMLANILDCEPKQVKIGQRVKVTFEKASDDITLPQFKLAT